MSGILYVTVEFGIKIWQHSSLTKTLEAVVEILADS